jgi:segregation and condensation protein B
MDQDLIQRIVEAALLAANQPLSLAQLSALFAEDAPAPPGAIEQALQQLREDCATRGVELVEVASGFRYQVRADLQPWVARLWTERQTRYSRATLETLALIAYRQPITRGEIEQIRGVAVNSNLVKTLEEREWIRVVGHRDVPGKPELLGTTRAFLDYFGLKSLDQLPPLSELREVPELDPQLPFAGAPLPAMLGDDAAFDPHAFDNDADGEPDDEDLGLVAIDDADLADIDLVEVDSIELSIVEVVIEPDSTVTASPAHMPDEPMSTQPADPADADAHEQTP